MSLLPYFSIWALQSSSKSEFSYQNVFHLHKKQKIEEVSADVTASKEWYQAHGISWYPSNKRPDKLRDTLQEVEHMLAVYHIAGLKWLSQSLCVLILANGVLLWLLISRLGNIDKIVIDRTIISKLGNEKLVFKALILESSLILVFSNSPQILLISLNRQIVTDSSKKLEKLSSYEPKFSFDELPLPFGLDHLNFNLFVNSTQDMLIVWFKEIDGLRKTEYSLGRDIPNTYLYQIYPHKLKLLNRKKTEKCLLYASFSTYSPRIINTVEQSSLSIGNSSVYYCSYEVSSDFEIKRQIRTRISLKSQLIFIARNLAEDKLMLACDDTTLVLYDIAKITVIQRKCTYGQAKFITFHPSDLFIFVYTLNNHLLTYDISLTHIKFQMLDSATLLTSIESRHLELDNAKLNNIYWQTLDSLHSPSSHPVSAILAFELGPIGVFFLEKGNTIQGLMTAFELMTDYLHCNMLKESVNLLKALNWNTQTKITFSCLTLILNELLKRPMEQDLEYMIETCLGTFLAPPHQLLDHIIEEYNEHVLNFARRFCLILIRNLKLDRAFLLAIDIGHRDLFMDVHFAARGLNEHALAEAALKRANTAELKEEITAKFEQNSHKKSPLKEVNEPEKKSHSDLENYFKPIFDRINEKKLQEKLSNQLNSNKDESKINNHEKLEKSPSKDAKVVEFGYI